jgi:hypothetical protein
MIFCVKRSESWGIWGVLGLSLIGKNPADANMMSKIYGRAVNLRQRGCRNSTTRAFFLPSRRTTVSRFTERRPGSFEVCFGPIVLTKSVRDRGGRKLQREPTASQAGFGCGIGTSLASFRRFCAVAASINSSRAPFGPRSRSRSSLRMRLRNHPMALRSRERVPSTTLEIRSAFSNFHLAGMSGPGALRGLGGDGRRRCPTPARIHLAQRRIWL